MSPEVLRLQPKVTEVRMISKDFFLEIILLMNLIITALVIN